MTDRYMVMASGQRVDVPDPKPGQIKIEDCALQTSRLPRFVGASNRFYSVAQHSITVAYVAMAIAKHSRLRYQAQGGPGSLIREGLGHDLAEAITGDCPSPVKAAIGPAYKAVERSIERGVRRDLGLSEAEPHVVWQADKIILYVEAKELCSADLDMQYVPEALQNLITHLDNDWWNCAMEITKESWTAEEAYTAFMREWNLCNG